MFESASNPQHANWIVRLVCLALAVALGWGLVVLVRMTHMPLRSFKGPLPPLTPEQANLAFRLTGDVKSLSATIGERNLQQLQSLHASADYIRRSLEQFGYEVADLPYSIEGEQASNLEARLAGTEAGAGEIIVGAHYDSVAGCVGADDNASGVAAVLELARVLRGSKLRRTVRFVLFANEEPPYFQTEAMGSVVYARQLHREGVRVSAMMSLEMLGYYSDKLGSQKYPPLLNLFYPREGNFIAFVGNSESRELVRRAIREFRGTARFPSEGIAAPADLPGIGWSDQWSFWQEGYLAIMVTDTALFRYPHYHTSRDTVDKLDFEKMARVVDGVRHVVEALSKE